MSSRGRTGEGCSETDFWLRRISLLGSVLPVATDLRPGEHLQGAIYRAASSNGLSNTDPIVELAGTSTFRRLSAFTALEDSIEIERLVNVLGIRPESERLLEVLKAPGARTREHVSFFGHVVRRAHISPRRRVSPRALAGQGYQRAIWSLRPLEFDPGTRELLLSHCPICGMALGWSKAAGVIYCEWCPDRTVDLRDFPQQLVQPEDGEALNFVGDLVNPEVTDAAFSKWRLLTLCGASRGDLFQLVVKIASEIQRAESGCYSASIRYKHLERAGRAVLGWPKSFVALAETTVRQGDSKANLKELPLWRLRFDPTLSAGIRRQMKTMRHTSRNRSVATSSGATLDEKSSECGSYPSGPLRSPWVELQRLVGRHHSCYEGSDAVVTVKVLRNIQEVQNMSLWLGLPVFDVYELYIAGFLPDLRASLTDSGFPPPSHEAVVTVRQIIDTIPAMDFPGSHISLSSVRFALDLQMSTPWSMIFRGILKGKVGLYRARGRGRGVAQGVYLNDFATIDNLLRATPKVYLPSSLLLTQNELAMSMGKSRSTAARFVELMGIGNELTFGRVCEERGKWITSFELRILLQRRGIDPMEMIEDLRKSNVTFLDGKGVFLWARAEAMECFGLPVDTE